ncbi:MAG TPA: ABC transporter transmembrane domain-containing protein [Vicinamibacterales bacterium]|nr:ABC transporter transmembrane domain-containing protein [Vicinamibacterales bacterium]
MKEFLRLLRYAAPYRGQLTAALLAMLLYAAGSALLVYLIKPILDKVLPAQQQVGQVAILLLVAYFLKGLGSYVSGYLMTQVGQRVVMDLRNQLFRHILGQSAAFFSRRTSGQLISHLTNDVGQVHLAVSETAADLVRESLAVIFYVGLLFYFDWRLALVCLTAAPLIVYPLARLGQRVRRTTRRSQEELEHVTHLSAEALSGHRIVKAFGAEERETSRFARATHSLFRTNMKITGAMSALPPLMEFIGGLAAVGLLWWGAQEISRAGGRLTPGGFTSFLATAFLMYGPIKKLSRVNAGIQQTIAACQRIFHLLDTHTEVLERPGAPPLARLRTQVEFRDVGFAYEDEPTRHILRHVSFGVRAGQVVAIVGLSGAGKTTLVNLIPRFYDVTEGAILIDAVDIRTVTLRSLREQIALVTQETVLFDDSIAANIAYGVPQATRDEIVAAATAAHAHEFIVHLPRGYDTTIGERGQRLSGGQRQRLAIARAILKNCPLLVLDEATSSLDAESELLVQDALANLMRDRTTFVIAHRLSTVRRADLIVALEKGEVAEIGSHDDLVARPGGVYARLYALQAFDERDGEPDLEPSDLAREVRS